MGRSCWCTRAGWVTEGPTAWGSGSAGAGGDMGTQRRTERGAQSGGTGVLVAQTGRFGVGSRAGGSQPGAQGLSKGEGGKGKRPWGFSRVAVRGMVTDGCGSSFSANAQAVLEVTGTDPDPPSSTEPPMPGAPRSHQCPCSVPGGSQLLHFSGALSAPLISSPPGGSLLLSRVKHITGLYQLSCQQEPASLKRFSLSSFHSLKK